MRKGQAEVVGLLVIVILLIFLGFIYVQFAVIGGGDDTYASVRENIEAGGLLRALLTLDTGEPFKGQVTACYYDSTACTALSMKIQEIFSVVLQGDEDYKLTLLAQEEILLESGGCVRGIASRVPFTFDGIFYEARLLLCRVSE